MAKQHRTRNIRATATRKFCIVPLPCANDKIIDEKRCYTSVWNVQARRDAARIPCAPTLSKCSISGWFSALFAVVDEINQAVAVVNLDVKEPQGSESEDAGNLGSRMFADRRHVDRQNVLVLLFEVGKVNLCFVGAVDLLDFAADAANFGNAS